MESFSVTALTSLCASITSRAASGAAELQIFTSDSRCSTLLDLAGSLTQLGYIVPQLEDGLNSATSMSQNLQTLLKSILTTGDVAIGRLHKQVMRISLEKANLLDHEYVAKHNKLLEAFADIAGFFVEVLSLPDRNEQDALLVAGGQQKLQNVEDSFNACSSTASILLQESSSEKISNGQNGVSSHYGHSVQQQPDNNDDDAPPPYVEQAATSSGPTNRPRENGGPSTESSFASKFKAFTSHFVSKPHPLASALCQAVTNGDAQQVSGLLNQGAKVDGRNGDGKTPLQCAIATDNEYLFHILLAAGASPKGQGWSGSRLPPLFQAANDGKLRIAQSLLERGADIAEANLIGQPYFYEACRLGNVQGVEFLLKNGANAKTQNIAGRPVLVTAVINGNLELTSLLLKFGADANCTDVTGSPVAVNAIEKKGIAMMSLLLDHGADPNATNVFGNHLLSAAISASRPDVARLLLDRGAKGRIYYVSGEPVFISVIKHAKLSIDDKEDLLERLLNKGAKASESDNWGIPALRYVLESSSSTQKMLELLLRNGAKPNDVEMAEGSTPLLYAMDKGKREEAKLLLQYGADVNATDEQKRLPLMQAVVKGDVEMAKMMKSQGARIDEQGLVSVASVARLLNRQDMMDAIGLKPE